MSPGDSSAPSTKAKSKAIQDAVEDLKDNFKAEHDNNLIKRRLMQAWYIVRGVILQTGDAAQEERLRNESEFKAYVSAPGGNREQELIKLLRSMAKQEVPWRDLFQNQAFLKPELVKKIDLRTACAIKDAWDGTYKGDLVDVLCGTIADYLAKGRTPYARLTTVVNSSGTGKSRMVDQLGTEVITVPMCLRQRREGFPPPDADLQRWLFFDSGDSDTQLESIAEEKDIPKLPRLSEETAEQVEYVPSVVDRQRKLATAFREHMNEGQLYHTSSPNRSTFYARVIAKAKQFVEHSIKDKKEPGASKDEDLQQAGKALCSCIDEYDLLDSDDGPRRPLVVFAFDEADSLIDNPPDQHWNLFTELRRVIRQIDDLPIFSLFLSTAGRFDKFSPVIHSDPSARVREPDNRPLDPISEISFDDIAYPALEGTITIGKVVEIDWMSHLGRPLFGSHWDHLPKTYQIDSAVIDYAKQKLLDGPTELRDNNWAGSLACLSIRFALEFNMAETAARDVSVTQVERHMRLCIAATAGLEKLITIPGSEPLLAEAAYELMKDTKTNAVRHLAGHSDLNCIDRGRRGELVAVLLIMQAYDAARLKGQRWVPVVKFMKALLPPSEFRHLLHSKPTSWPMNYDGKKTFKMLFKDYGMWFNHVIKIEDQEMISIEHLWKFVVRGAMILCAANQEGIDIVLPVCHVKQHLGPDSLTAIIIQVKNAKRYAENIQSDLFHKMNRVVKSAIFCKPPEPEPEPEPEVEVDSDSESTPVQPERKRRKTMTMDQKPVIQLVLALASPKPAIIFKPRPEKRHHFDRFTAFEIWLAGLSDKTYKQMDERDLVHYQTLLERSLTPHDAFELGDVPHIGEGAKKLRGARRRRMVPLAFPEGAHHGIHQGKDLKKPGEGSGGQPGAAIQPGTRGPQSSAHHPARVLYSYREKDPGPTWHRYSTSDTRSPEQHPNYYHSES